MARKTISPAEEQALVAALQAYQQQATHEEGILMAARMFRGLLPPRPLRAADKQPDPEAGGIAARKIFDAADKGLLRQADDQVLRAAGRALIEAAYPSTRLRRAQGTPNYEAAGSAANACYTRLDRKRGRPEDRNLHIAIGRAGLQAAWPQQSEPGK